MTSTTTVLPALASFKDAPWLLVWPGQPTSRRQLAISVRSGRLRVLNGGEPGFLFQTGDLDEHRDAAAKAATAFLSDHAAEGYDLLLSELLAPDDRVPAGFLPALVELAGGLPAGSIDQLRAARRILDEHTQVSRWPWIDPAIAHLDAVVDAQQ